MTSKTELNELTEQIIQAVRASSTNFFYTLLPTTSGKYSAVIQKAIDLQKELTSVADTDENKLLDIKKTALALEAEMGRLRTRLGVIPSIILIYFGFGLVYFLIVSVDIPKFITETLGVQTPEKLITLGIAGAFVYLATSYLKTLESPISLDSQIRGIIDFSLRLSLAIVVPIVLVVLFFTEEGTIGEVTLSPEILSFLTGYSAKLVTDLFSKLVEKGSNMIEAI